MDKGRRSAGAYEIVLEKIKSASHMVLRPHAWRDIQNDKVADTLERGASLFASQDLSHLCYLLNLSHSMIKTLICHPYYMRHYCNNDCG